MKRLAAFLLLAGIVPIPLLAGDYFTTRRSLFSSENSGETVVKVVETKKETPKKAPTTKAETTTTATPVKVTKLVPVVEPTKKVVQASGAAVTAIAKVTKPVSVVEPTKTVVQASGVASTPRSSTSYMKSLFTTDSTAAWVGEPAMPNIAPTQIAGLSVYAVPPTQPVAVPQAVAAKLTKRPATTVAPAPETKVLAVGPIPTRPMIPAPTPSSMSLPPGTIIHPVEATVADVPAKPVARTLSPIRQSSNVAASPVHHAAAAAMPLPTGFKLVGGQSQGPYSGFIAAPQAAAPPAVPAAPVAPVAPAPAYGPYSGYGSSGYGPSLGYGSSGCCPTCGAGPRDSSGFCNGRLLAWAFYRPAKDTLPRFQPLPYVTPILAFRCAECGPGSYGGGCGLANCGTGNYATGNCATGNCATGNCATGNCAAPGGVAGRFGLGDRGCKSGCVSPSDNVFPGYRFASGSGPMGGQYQDHTTSYKPVAQAAAPVAAPAAYNSAGYYKPVYSTDSGVKPASGDVLARPFTRP